MANYPINPYGQGGELPAGYPIADDLVTDSAQQALSARQGKRLKEMLDEFQPDAVLGVRTSPTRQLTLTTSGTSKQAQYPLYGGSLVHFKVTLGAAVTGKTYLIAMVDNSSTGQKVLLTVEAGSTTAEADVEIDKMYNYLTLYNGDTSLASANITVEVSHKCNVTGNDGVASVVQTAYEDKYKVWKKSILKIPVKKGNVIYFCGYAQAGSIVTLHTSYNGSAVASYAVASGYPADVAEGFITVEQDGYAFFQSNANNFEPTFILFANEKLKDEIVVAASNTPNGIKQQADYFCTGTNDEVLLNQLIEAGIRLARTVKLLRGDYYLDAPTKQYDAANDTFLLVNTSPLASGDSSSGVNIVGEDAFHRPELHVGNSAYEALDSSTQYRVLGVKDSTTYGGYVLIEAIKIRLPYNQKKICAIDMVDFGGWARIHDTDCRAFTSGYNGQTIDMSHPPRQAVDGCIGIRFIGKGPNGGYGSEIFNGTIAAFNEGVCINTEWTVCYHICPYFCVKSWVFGRYTRGTVHASTHPTVLIMCGSERSNSPALFYQNSGFQQIEIIAFSMERDAQNCPVDANGNKVLGPLAKVEGGSGNGLEFRGSISYTAYNPHSGVANNVDIGFWEFGHGHGMKTTDASHAQAGTTTLRNTYRPNFMQRYFDTSLGTNGKEIICIDESGSNGKGTWVDAAGNIV